MKIKAKKGFCGALCMAAGEIREYNNETVLADLLRAGYVEEVREKEEHLPESMGKNESSPEMLKTRRKVKTGESKRNTGG